jgi:anti-sigma factor RsiW
MTITRDIVIDLLPAYESGDASADTRAAVEAYLANDADFARIVKAARRSAPITSADVSGSATRLERDALDRTRRALKKRSWTLALAILFTLMPFTFAFRGSDVVFFMWRDEPGSRLFLLSAAWLWWSYFRQSQAFRKAGW